MDCVVDASVGIKLYVAEELSDRADALFSLLTGEAPPTMVVPDLFRVECANVLWKHVRRGEYGLAQAQQAIATLAELSLVWVPEVHVIADAFHIATTYDVTVYDAIYAALASLADVPLITADDRLVRKLHGSGVAVLSLADYRGD